MGDKTQLAQVMINFVKNSIDAIDEKGKKNGAIRISTKDIIEDNDPAVQIVTYDNGCGINPDILSDIFDFGVSSKKSKKSGRGFGLFYSKKTVEKYGGSIKVESKLNEYTKFTILFPHVRREQNEV